MGERLRVTADDCVLLEGNWSTVPLLQTTVGSAYSCWYVCSVKEVSWAERVVGEVDAQAARVAHVAVAKMVRKRRALIEAKRRCMLAF